jgi:hypothetical protein
VGEDGGDLHHGHRTPHHHIGRAEELVLVLLALSFGDYKVLETSSLRGELLNLVGEKWLALSQVIRNDRVRFSTADPRSSDSVSKRS